MSGARSDVYADLCAWTWDVGVEDAVLLDQCVGRWFLRVGTSRAGTRRVGDHLAGLRNHDQIHVLEG